MLVNNRIVYIILCSMLLVLTPAFDGRAAAEANHAKEYYISPAAEKGGTGAKDCPFSSFVEAKAALREITKSGMDSDITVYLAGGVYNVDEKIVFGSKDSGKNGYTITYRNLDNDIPVITSSVKIDGWQPYKDGIYKANIERGKDIQIMYENNAFSYKARYPNKIEGLRDGYAEAVRTSEDENGRKFYFNKKEMPYVDDTSSLEVFTWPGGPGGYYNWSNNLTNVADIDYRKGKISLTANNTRTIGAGSRYYIEGAMEFLDAEGEFYYNKNSGIVYYKPRNLPIEKQDIRYAKLTRVFEFAGGSADKKVRNITLSGLKFTGNNRVAQSPGAGANADAFIYMANAEYIKVENSIITGIATDAFDIMGNGINNISVCNNKATNIGGFFCKVYNTRPMAYSYSSSHHHIISNNLIKNSGVLFPECEVIRLMWSSDNIVTYNKISDCPHQGVTVYGNVLRNMPEKNAGDVALTEANFLDYNYARNNTIAFNDISNCDTETQDTGPIYTWCGGKNNIVNNNYIHDSDINFSFGMGIYYDDQTHYTVTTNNIVADLQKKGEGKLLGAIFYRGMGHIAYNNFFVDNNTTDGAIYTTGTTSGTGPNIDIDFQRNIILNSGNNVHGVNYSWSSDRYKFCDYNLFFNDSGIYNVYNVSPTVKTFDDWRKMNTAYGLLDAHSKVEYPSFVDSGNRDFRLKYDSSAYTLGIKDIDEGVIGLKEDFPYADKNEDISKIFLYTDTDDMKSTVRLDSQLNNTSKIKVLARTTSGYIDDLANTSIAYKTDNDGICKVDENGVITALSKGIAKVLVTVSKNNKELSLPLYVIVDDDVKTAELRLNANRLDLGGKTSGLLTITTEQNTSFSLEKAEWSSTNSGVAYVGQNNEIIANGVGKAEITATANVMGKTVTASAPIQIFDGMLQDITIAIDKSDGLLAGDTAQTSVQKGILSNGKEVLPSSLSTVYSSKNEEVAAVDQNGVITAKGYGRTRIVASCTLDGVSREATKEIFVWKADKGNVQEPWKMSLYGKAMGYADFTQDSIYMVTNGIDIFGKSDDGMFVNRKVSDNKTGFESASVSATVDSLYLAHMSAGSGVMLRAEDSADSAHASFRVSPNGATTLVWREVKGGATKYISGKTVTFPCQIKLEKTGNIFTAYINEGDGWEAQANTSMQMDNSGLLGGAALYSRGDISTESTIENLKIETK